MATKIVYEREKAKKASISVLEDYLKYLADITHEDHAGMTLLPGRNYNCGPSEAELVAAIDAMDKNYRHVRKLKGSGKCTADIWDEAIFNLGEGCFITEAERDEIEQKIIAEICPDSPARATWHIDPENGWDDLHIVFSTTTPRGTLNLARTETHLFRRQKSLDRWAADLLNGSKSKPKDRIAHIKTAAAVEKENLKVEARKKKDAEKEAKKSAKKKSGKSSIAKKEPVKSRLSLAEQLTNLADEEGIKEVEEEHIPGLLERLGLVIRIVGGTIYVALSRTKQFRKIRIPRTGIIHVDKMLDQILEIRINRELKRNKQREQ